MQKLLIGLGLGLVVGFGLGFATSRTPESKERNQFQSPTNTPAIIGDVYQNTPALQDSMTIRPESSAPNVPAESETLAIQENMPVADPESTTSREENFKEEGDHFAQSDDEILDSGLQQAALMNE